MTDKRLKTNFDTATALIYESGLTTHQAAAAMRKVIKRLPTVTQVMKNFALQARNARGLK